MLSALVVNPKDSRLGEGFGTGDSIGVGSNVGLGDGLGVVVVSTGVGLGEGLGVGLRVGLCVGLTWPTRFQIWSFALTLFRAFDFVCPFARSPFFGPFARFPTGKRFFQ